MEQNSIISTYSNVMQAAVWIKSRVNCILELVNHNYDLDMNQFLLICRL